MSSKLIVTGTPVPITMAEYQSDDLTCIDLASNSTFASERSNIPVPTFGLPTNQFLSLDANANKGHIETIKLQGLKPWFAGLRRWGLSSLNPTSPDKLLWIGN